MISVISYQLSTIISYITNIFIICNFLQLQHLTYLKKKDWHVSNSQYHTQYSLGAFHILRTHLGGGEGGLAFYTFPLCITCKREGEGVKIACKNAYVINGRPLE